MILHVSLTTHRLALFIQMKFSRLGCKRLQHSLLACQHQGYSQTRFRSEKGYRPKADISYTPAEPVAKYQGLPVQIDSLSLSFTATLTTSHWPIYNQLTIGRVSQLPTRPSNNPPVSYVLSTHTHTKNENNLKKNNNNANTKSASLHCTKEQLTFH